MNALQKRVLELFQAFLQVCQQLNLSYFLVCGSALGAVKYQGFIPWDDDMDLAMLRPDYEAFLAQAQALLPRHIFLQNYKTDPAWISSPWTVTRQSRPSSEGWSGKSGATAAAWPLHSPVPALHLGA